LTGPFRPSETSNFDSLDELSGGDAPSLFECLQLGRRRSSLSFGTRDLPSQPGPCAFGTSAVRRLSTDPHTPPRHLSLPTALDAPPDLHSPQTFSLLLPVKATPSRPNPPQPRSYLIMAPTVAFRGLLDVSLDPLEAAMQGLPHMSTYPTYSVDSPGAVPRDPPPSPLSCLYRLFEYGFFFLFRKTHSRHSSTHWVIPCAAPPPPWPPFLPPYLAWRSRFADDSRVVGMTGSFSSVSTEFFDPRLFSSPPAIPVFFTKGCVLFTE